jgi:protein-tyrosine phosphatase
MGLFNLFSRKKVVEIADFSFLKTDVHSHLIPGIDDGSQTMDETIGMLLKFSELGYKKVITTPHVMSDQYHNTSEIILSGLKDVQDEIQKLNIPITIDAAAEYYLDEFLSDKVKNHDVLTFGEKKYLLFELSFTTPPNLLDQFIFDVKMAGYYPVIAHFERYPYYFENGLTKMQQLRDKGVKIQMNMLSLTGHYGPQVKKQAEIMVKNGFVDLVGSDTHRIQHLQLLDALRGNPVFQKLQDMPLINYDL